MALWITKQRAQTGTVFGFTDQFEGLGLFIDTYKNGRAGITFPYVMAMLGDGRTPYDNENDGKANDIGGCSVKSSLKLLIIGSRNKKEQWSVNGALNIPQRQLSLTRITIQKRWRLDSMFQYPKHHSSNCILSWILGSHW
jgi:hypothetical protein